ncbi:hypothetical protein FRC12_016888 [Ceratobasidium sp. 428]|nr:hypothetical protein FRC12_016888 [Ceratobasidium sp. 428]
MQLTVATAFLAAVASFASAQSVPASAPGCVKYCLRIAREQAPYACTWAGWCNTSGFQDSVSNCYSNICGSTNQQRGAEIYQQICSSAGSNTACPSSGTASSTPSSSASASVTSSASTSSTASETSSAASTTSDLVTTEFGGVTTTLPGSVASSIAASLSSASASASSSASSVASSASSALSTATGGVSSAISSLLSSASNAASSAASAGASATQSQSPNAGVAVGPPTHAQIASIGALLLGAVAGALML